MGTLVGVLVLLLALYLAFRVVEAALKVVLWAVVLAAGYALAAPAFGWPGVPEVMDVIGGAIADLRLPQWLSALWDDVWSSGSPPPD